METGERMTRVQSQEYETLESLSTYMDGELPVESRDGLLASVKANQGLRAEWGLYHCIGDVLRSDDMGCHSPSFAQSFAARIEGEPYLFAPEVAKTFAAQQASVRRPWRMPASIAAGVAAAAIVGAAVVLPQRSGDTVQSAAQSVPVIAASDQAMRPVSNEYLMAHRYYSNGLAMQGVVSHVRTAGYDGK
jgi:sigma-E factor negative regulatory protein RseA